MLKDAVGGKLVSLCSSEGKEFVCVEVDFDKRGLIDGRNFALEEACRCFGNDISLTVIHRFQMLEEFARTSYDSSINIKDTKVTSYRKT